MRLTKENQNEIIKGCAQGKRSAQEILYHSLSPKMFSICLRYAKDYHVAEDLLQEGFIKVYKNIEKFRGEGSFEGWVRRIFVNTAIEHYRKSVHMYPVQEYDSVELNQYDDSTLDGLLEEDLMRLIQDLSPGYKAVFNMYVIEGFSHKEIAEKLDISEGTSKSQLARARYLLQKKVEEANQVAKSTKDVSNL